MKAEKGLNVATFELMKTEAPTYRVFKKTWKNKREKATQTYRNKDTNKSKQYTTYKQIL